MALRVWQDVRFGARMLAREPGFTAAAVAALALGIGVNTTVFTLVNAVLFRGLPFAQADRVMYLSGQNATERNGRMGVSYPDLLDWRSSTRSFSGLAAFFQNQYVLDDSSNLPERYSAARVTANVFSLIGQPTLLGRDFLPEEERAGAASVCILGYSIWDSRYARDPNVIGRTIRINDAPTTVIGVMPKGMRFPQDADLWLPVVHDAALLKRDNRYLQAFGRLADGLTLAQARQESDLIAARLAREHPETNKNVTTRIITYNDAFNGGQVRTVFLALLGAVSFVLLIACANVANLLLSRSLSRTREVSIRVALGAGRWRVVRQLLVESLMLGVMGGLLGLAIAYWGVRMFDLAVENVGKPYWIAFRIDFTVFAYLAGICVATSVLFGLFPALQVSKVNLAATLKEGGRGSSDAARSRYLSGFLVVSEVALSMVLLAGAGLMIRSFLNIYGITSGIPGDKMLVMRLSLPQKRYPDDGSRRRFYDRLETTMASMPGVESATILSHSPTSGAFRWPFEVEGAAPIEGSKLPGVFAVLVSPAYFQAVSLPVIHGRALAAIDGLPDKEGVVVNQRFAARFWPGEDPIGKRIRVHWEGERPWLAVVGVCQDFHQTRNDDGFELEPVIYVPYRVKPIGDYQILLRAAVPPTSLANPARREIRALDEGLAVSDVRTLAEAYARERWAFRVFGSLFAIFALIALLLSSVGLYAVMAYSVQQRRQEIGVRMAIGASGASILLLMISRGARQLGLGVGLGLLAAFGVARVLKSLLVGVTPTDPLTFAAISGVLLTVGLAACWLPAQRAMRLDPTVALRQD